MRKGRRYKSFFFFGCFAWLLICTKGQSRAEDDEQRDEICDMQKKNAKRMKKSMNKSMNKTRVKVCRYIQEDEWLLVFFGCCFVI